MDVEKEKEELEELLNESKVKVLKACAKHVLGRAFPIGELLFTGAVCYVGFEIQERESWSFPTWVYANIMFWSRSLVDYQRGMYEIMRKGSIVAEEYDNYEKRLNNLKDL